MQFNFSCNTYFIHIYLLHIMHVLSPINICNNSIRHYNNCLHCICVHTWTYQSEAGLTCFLHLWCSDSSPAAPKPGTEPQGHPGRVGTCPPSPVLSAPVVHSPHVGCVTQVLCDSGV